MPLTPQELEFMQQYTSGAPPDALRARLDDMYAPVSPEMQQAAFGGPDARTAQNMSVDPMVSTAPIQNAPPPAPPPVATDAGGLSGGGPIASVAPPPTMSTVTPEQQAQMGAEAEARLAAANTPEEAPQSPAQPTYDPAAAAMQREALQMARGSRGQVVPGGEQLSGRTVSRELHGKLSPETSEELDYAQRGAEGLAVEQGESAAAGLEKVAAQQRANAQSTRSELSKYNRDLAAKQTEYDMRQSELDDMRADIQKNPATYWSGKGVGTQILNAIGLMLLGLDKNQGAAAIQNIVNSEVDRKQKERGAAVSLLQDRLNRFERGIPNPEAAQAFRRSLALEAAAAETESLASTAKSEEVRQRGYAAASQMRLQALQARAAGETGLLGKEEVKTANTPTKVVGGARGKTLAERAKAMGLTPEQEARLEYNQQLPSGGGGPQTELDLSKAKYERSVAVRLPNGETAYASDPDQKKELQGALVGSTALQKIYADLANIREHHAVTGQWDRKAIGRAKVDVSKITLQLKKAEQLGVLSQGDLALIEPLTGGGIEDFIVGPQFDGALERSRELNNASSQNAMELLNSSPWGASYITNPAGGKGSTFKPEGE